MTGPFRLRLDHGLPERRRTSWSPLYITVGAAAGRLELRRSTATRSSTRLVAAGQRGRRRTRRPSRPTRQAEDLLVEDMPMAPLFFGVNQGAHSENVEQRDRSTPSVASTPPPSRSSADRAAVPAPPAGGAVLIRTVAPGGARAPAPEHDGHARRRDRAVSTSGAPQPRGDMGRYVARRLLLTIPVLIGASFLIFAMVYALPGDPIRALGRRPAAVAGRGRPAARRVQPRRPAGRPVRQVRRRPAAGRPRHRLPRPAGAATPSSSGCR